MSDLELHIKRINTKLQQLLKNYQLLQKENQRQSELIATLQQTKEKDKEQINTLQEKISILKAATGNMNEADKKVFEKNISQYIREIDKCIGILSGERYPDKTMNEQRQGDDQQHSPGIHILNHRAC
jgi:uncharacterized phage infection (PIP) family protein YhgE